jgi:hypothetical protein
MLFRFVAPLLVLLFAGAAAGCGSGQADRPSVSPILALGIPEAGVGDSCTTNDDCTSGMCDRTFPGGYCSARCEADADCPNSGLCRENFCLQRCVSRGDCRDAQYTCYAANAEQSIGVCGFDTAQLAEAPNVGAPCTADVECIAPQGTDPRCMVETTIAGNSTGFPGGACLAVGCSDDAPCGEGAVCVPGRFPLCMAACDTAADCRSGYSCDEEVAACVPESAIED